MIINYNDFSYTVDTVSFIINDSANKKSISIPSNGFTDTAVVAENDSIKILYDKLQVTITDIPGGFGIVQALVDTVIADILTNTPSITATVTFPASQNVVVTNSPTVSISGTPTVNATVSNFPVTQAVSGNVGVNNFPATQPVSGTVSVGNFPATQTVSLPAVNYDSFGRLRVSNPKTLFDITFTYDIQTEMMGSLVTGAATIALGANDKMVSVTATAVGNKAVFQSKQYHTYQPGKSLLIKMSGLLTSNIANTGTTRVGFFDDANDKSTGAINGNGIFFECTAGNVSLVRRTFTSGVQVDNSVSNASWNGDKLNGTGSSGVTIDWSKTQILFIALQWLGAGSISCGVIHQGQYIIAHTFHNNNSLTVPYMQTGCLPIRWEAVTTAGQTAECKAVCGVVESEGGFSLKGKYRSAHNIGSAVSVDSTLSPVFTIRKKSAYNRVTVNPISLCEIGASTDNVALLLIRNGTNGSGTYNGVTDSAVEYCIGGAGGLSLSGGNIIKTYLSSADSVDTIITEFEDVIKLWASIAGVSDTLTLAMQKITGGSKNITASMSWQEWY